MHQVNEPLVEIEELTNSEDILVMKNITKTFLGGKIVANDNITLNIKKNEIHSIIGENGSGKSTLMSILFGLYKQDKGQIFLNGKVENMYHSGAAKKHKIGMVHQHFHLIDKFSVLENIILGQEEQFSKAGVINYKKAEKHFKSLTDKYNFHLDPWIKVKKLNVGQKQKVEILKVLWDEKDIIVFDEPTATLSVKEIAELLEIIKILKQQGKTIIFISHKLQEVKEISDSISVLNKGKHKGTFNNHMSLTKDEIAQLMFSNIKQTELNMSSKKITTNPILKIEDLIYDTSSGFRALNGVSFEINEGEIFGIAGIEGNGQEEIINCITGLKKMKSGKISIRNQDISNWKISKKAKFISHIPIDRIKYGIVSEMSIEFNSIISDLNNPKYGKIHFSPLNKNIILDKKQIQEHTNNIIMKLNVDGANDTTTPIRNLSGGNQQKFITGRELLRNHEVMIAGHPTRGLDIMAISNIYQKLIDNSRNKATLIYSLEISELMNVCDRIAILYKGSIVDIIDPKITNLDVVSRLMIGEKDD